MAGWQHSSVAKCIESNSAYVPSKKSVADAGSDPTAESDSDSEPTPNSNYTDESIDESAAESKPAWNSNPKLESRTDNCDNSH